MFDATRCSADPKRNVYDPDAHFERLVDEQDVIRKLMFVRLDEENEFDAAELKGCMHDLPGDPLGIVINKTVSKMF